MHPALVSHVSDQSECLPHSVECFNLYYAFPVGSNAIEKRVKKMLRMSEVVKVDRFLMKDCFMSRSIQFMSMSVTCGTKSFAEPHL